MTSVSYGCGILSSKLITSTEAAAIRNPASVDFLIYKLAYRQKIVRFVMSFVRALP